MYEEEIARIAERILRLSFRYRIPVGDILQDCEDILQDCYAATGKEWVNTQTQLTGWVD